MLKRKTLIWIIGCVYVVIFFCLFVNYSPSRMNNPGGGTVVKAEEESQRSQDRSADDQMTADKESQHNQDRSADDQVDENEQLLQDMIAEDRWKERFSAVRGEANLTLINQSGMDVLVKVVSVKNPDSYTTVSVRNNSSEEVKCPAEDLFLKMRYQTPEGFQYQKGDRFYLASDSKAEITLHKVTNGNYGSTAMGQNQF